MLRFKIILMHLLIVAMVCGLGVLACYLLHLPVHSREMAIAAVICLCAAELAMIPIFIVSGKPADNVVQGALISTIIHMGVAAISGVTVLQLLHPPQAFLFWLCGFYWTTLAGVCRVLLQAIKAAPIPAAQPLHEPDASERNMNFLLAVTDPMEEILPHVLFPLGPFVFTNQMLMTVLAAVLMLIIFPALFSYSNASAPTGSRNFFEAILEFLRVEVIRPALKDHADRFVPFLWTLFFFILFSNVLGQFPVNELCTVVAHLFGSHHEFEFWGTATGTPITTGALAIVAFFLIHISGVMEIARGLINGTYGQHDHHTGHDEAEDFPHMRGDALAADVPGDLRALTDPAGHYDDGMRPNLSHVAHPDNHDQPHVNPVAAVLQAVPLYLWNFAPHPFRPTPDKTGVARLGMWIADIIMWSILLVLELLGAVIKPFSLTIRLFANMIGGHIVLGALILLIPVTASLAAQVGYGTPITILSLVIRCLELFVAFLQAYIFTFLVTLFIASSVAPEH